MRPTAVGNTIPAPTDALIPYTSDLTEVSHAHKLPAFAYTWHLIPAALSVACGNGIIKSAPSFHVTSPPSESPPRAPGLFGDVLGPAPL
mmetsp:Transcript_15594/g.25283  ORF Transcript_15594/g.25283 Transcript_15594/m.25283 type:complete len:89 (-) Transcript_15594:2016-2282(-)